MRDRLDERLAEQNQLAGWVDCEAAGGRHRWRKDRAQLVGAFPTAVYTPCASCPVTKRTTR